MIKRMTKLCIFALVLIICMMSKPVLTTVLATSDNTSNYEAKIIIKSVSSGGTTIAEYNYETLEEAFSMAATKEAEHNPKGTGGNITVTIQLLKDSEVEETLVANSNKSNFMLDVNGFNITSSADPVFQAGLMTFITNSAGTSCSIIQKNVTTVSTTTPNTIIYAPSGVTMININAENLTVGDDTGTALNINAMLPSIQNGIFLGELTIGKPMFGAAISGGYYSKDPTAHIDTNAYVALKNDDGLYYLTKYHAATVDKSTGNIIKKYGLAQEAIDAAETDGLVKILKQDYPPKTVIINSDDKLTLDLAGFQFTGAASPNALIRVEGTSLLQNKGTLTMIDTDEADPGALNFVYDDNFKGDCFCTILNQGTLNLNGISVSVNYNHPNYKGNIYTLCNDSSSSDAKLYIDSASKVGGLKLEPEDPATGKYTAISTRGNGSYANEVHIEYYGKDNTANTEDDDTVIFYVENADIGEIMDVFDANGNYTTTFSLNNGIDLQKRNISVKKDGVEVDFEYDSTTDNLTIPAELFTDDADEIEIRLKYEVTYIADNKTVEVVTVEHGKNATAPQVPEKEGFTGKWDSEAKKVIKDTTITAIYTPISQNEEDNATDENNENTEDNKENIENNSNKENADGTITDTGDHSNIEVWISLLVVSTIVLTRFIKRPKKGKRSK